MSQRNFRERIEAEVRKSVLNYAIFRPESALVIAMTLIFILLSLVPQMPWFPGEWWLWFLFGLVGEALIVISTLRDEKFYQHVVDQLFRQEFDLKNLRSNALRQKLQKALDYHDLIVKEIEREDDPVLDDYLLDVARSLEGWIAQIYHLAKGLDVYQADPVIARDMQSTPLELQKLKTALKAEKQSAVRAELEKTIATKESQWETLRNLRETMERTELQLENTLAAMGTVYTQVVLLGAKDVNSPRAQRLQEDVSEQIYALEDVSQAMDEVYYLSEK